MKKAIQIDDKDNVATVTSNLEPGEIVEVLSPEGEIIVTPKTISTIPFGHKIALINFNKNDHIIKFGEIIGVASQQINAGEWAHTHNVESATVPTSAYTEEPE